MVAVRPKTTTVEEILAGLGGRSHGVVTRAELLGAGVTPSELKQRVRIGGLIAIHRGVFRVGHAAPSIEARYLAAVKACGDDAVLGGRAAGHLLGLIRGSAPPPDIVTRSKRRVKGVNARRSQLLAPRDVTRWRGVPVMTVPRTMVDLAALLTPGELARAFHEAAVRHRTTPGSVEAVLARRHNWPGARELRRVLWGEEPVSLSKLEASFVARLRNAGLPLPETNCLVDGRRVDCRWPENQLTVELDGYRYHHTRHAWEQDRRREREARGRGDEFRRYTYSDVIEDPGPMLDDLHSLLGLDRA